MAIVVEIEKVVIKEKVSVETPYFYKHDLLPDFGDSIVYGKVLDDCVVTVQKTDRYGGKVAFEIQVVKKSDLRAYSNYLVKEEYRSTEGEFLAVLGEMKDLTNEVILGLV